MQIIVPILLIIAGSSGEFVLRGTNSSEYLVIFGIVLLIFRIIKLSIGSNANADETNQLTQQKYSSEVEPHGEVKGMPMSDIPIEVVRAYESWESGRGQAYFTFLNALSKYLKQTPGSFTVAELKETFPRARDEVNFADFV